MKQRSNKVKLQPLYFAGSQNNSPIGSPIRKQILSFHESNRKPIFSMQKNTVPLIKKKQLILDLDQNFQYVMKIATRTQLGTTNGKPNKNNQDIYITCPNIGNKTYLHYFIICDGHGKNGNLVVNFLKKSFTTAINRYHLQLENNPNQAIYTIFTQVSESLKFQNFDTLYSGSTVVGVLILHNKLFCSNLGDSKAILLSRTDKWFLKNLSRDHKPYCQDEANRIIMSNGIIEQQKDIHSRPIGPLRIWFDKNGPGLAMTRSMGDQIAKNIGVIDIPEIFTFTLEKMDRVLLIGSDGVFEYLSEFDLIKCISPYIDQMKIDQACEELLSITKETWIKQKCKSIDDITFILLFFQYI